MSSSELPLEVRIATECSSALDRGDKTMARPLAEQGLELATKSGNPKWMRRFQHLLRASTGTPIEGPKYEPPLCSFCLTRGRSVTAGPEAFICDACIRYCSGNRLDDSPLERIFVADVACSFCQQQPSVQPLFGAQGYYICTRCVERCVEMAQ